VLLTRSPSVGWTRTGLERACEVGSGSLDDHLDAAVGLGLLQFKDGRFHTPRRASLLARSLRSVLRETAGIKDTPADPLPRRSYSRPSE
jgi:hypothetical protein